MSHSNSIRTESAYEFETDEWNAAVQSMTEMERAVATEEPHAHLGVIGDRSDAGD